MGFLVLKLAMLVCVLLGSDPSRVSLVSMCLPLLLKVAFGMKLVICVLASCGLGWPVAMSTNACFVGRLKIRCLGRRPSNLKA